jgi:dTDP-4-amino-4,6-dideoxygalactose transaminase
MQIPLTIEDVGAEEQAAMAAALRARQLTGNGPICRAVQQELQTIFGARHALLTPSCTSALEMAMLALDIGPGDEVILPSFTFVSTANCVMLRGATPVFADILPDTLNIDPADVARRITPRTRAIVPVHYAGVACAMDALLELSRAHGLAVVEDAAHAIDARYKGRYLGTLGDFGCYSFHATKNIVCGEGGALLTSSDALAARAHVIHEKGTNRAAFMQGLVDKYSWVDVGSSYVLSDLLAAVLQVQLGKRAAIKARRGAIWRRYFEGLRPLAERELLALPTIPPECDSSYHIFFLRVASGELRDRLLQALRAAGIGAAFHYVPLHSSPFGQSQGWHHERLPVTEQCSRTLIRLPLYPAMSDAQVEYVLDTTIALLELLAPAALAPRLSCARYAPVARQSEGRR